MDYPALEHGSSRTGRWLRGRRFRLALLVALVEGILVVVGVVPAWLALVVGVAVVALHFAVGRTLGSDTLRQASWTAALSQLLVALVPVLAFVVTALAVVALVAIGLVALVALLADRR